MSTNDLSNVVAGLALVGTVINGYLGWRRRRYISIKERDMEDGLLNKVKHLLFDEPTRWAELLLGLIKIMLGLTLFWYLWDPPKSTAVLTVAQAASIGVGIFLLGFFQIVTVFVQQKWPRFVVCCLATGMWIFFMGSQYLASGSIRSILIYIPLLMFNIVVALRIARIVPRSAVHSERV